MTKKLIVCLTLFLAHSLVAQPIIDSTLIKKILTPNGYTTTLNAVYTEVGDWQGRVDMYYNTTNPTPTPIVINIHGGGWNKGIKESQSGFGIFFENGFAVANMEYRLSQQATAPAAVEDVRSLLCYLVDNAKKFNINTNQIVIMGGSAGGHLALMGGLLAENTLFDSNCKMNKGIKVAAIIDKYGITDVYDWTYGLQKSKSAKQWLGNQWQNEPFIKSVSPLNYVSASSPPIFIVHGDADPIVPYQQSVDLYQKLKEKKVISQFITIKGGMHGKFSKKDNEMIKDEMILFLKKLKLFNSI
jgi:acetyl esterase/lipase